MRLDSATSFPPPPASPLGRLEAEWVSDCCWDLQVLPCKAVGDKAKQPPVRLDVKVCVCMRMCMRMCMRVRVAGCSFTVGLGIIT